MTLAKRRLARSARPDDAEHLARAYLERYAEQDRAGVGPANADLIDVEVPGRARERGVDPFRRRAAERVGQPLSAARAELSADQPPIRLSIGCSARLSRIDAAMIAPAEM